MNNEANSDWIETTKLFKEWQTIKHEVSLHKWYESEKAGRDIGWERANIDWLIHHGTRNRQSSKS